MLGGRVAAALFHAAPAALVAFAGAATLAVCDGGAFAVRAQPPIETTPAVPPAAPPVVSPDGLLVLVAQADPPCLVVWHAARDVPVHTIVPAARDGRVATRIAVMRTAPLRRSFIVAPADLPELWEISYDPKAEEIYDGMVHDYRFGEGVPRRGYLGIRRTSIPEPLADLVLDEDEAEAWGLALPPPQGSGDGQVINLDVRRRVAVLPAAQMAAHMRARMQGQRDAQGTHGTRAQVPIDAHASGQAQAPTPFADLAQRRTASRPWPCAAPKVPGP